MDNKEFYMVFNPNGSAPKHRHYSFDEAKQEAIRLASTIPGQDFYVLATVGVYRGLVKVQSKGLTGIGVGDLLVCIAGAKPKTRKKVK